MKTQSKLQQIFLVDIDKVILNSGGSEARLGGAGLYLSTQEGEALGSPCTQGHPELQNETLSRTNKQTT